MSTSAKPVKPQQIVQAEPVEPLAASAAVLGFVKDGEQWTHPTREPQLVAPVVDFLEKQKQAVPTGPAAPEVKGNHSGNNSIPLLGEMCRRCLQYRSS